MQLYLANKLCIKLTIVKDLVVVHTQTLAWMSASQDVLLSTTRILRVMCEDVLTKLCRVFSSTRKSSPGYL